MLIFDQQNGVNSGGFCIKTHRNITKAGNVSFEKLFRFSDFFRKKREIVASCSNRVGIASSIFIPQTWAFEAKNDAFDKNMMSLSRFYNGS